MNNQLDAVIFGQNDYVARIQNYIQDMNVNCLSLPFPLQSEKPDQTSFELSLFDNVLKTLDKNVRIIVAFSIKNHAAASRYLRNHGFTNLVLYDAQFDNRMKKFFFQRFYEKKGIPFLCWEDIPLRRSVVVYMAKCIVDKTIAAHQPEMQSAYIVPIQVGAALTERRIADVLDSVGENISDRNRHYSEMTAFYWMWKNGTADYLGICHYRRLWVKLDQIVVMLQSGDVDAVLPLPTLCEHSVHEDYMLKHIPTVWQPMMEVMKKQSPEYYEAAQDIFKGKIFYASNMCILRREVLDDLCEWMFPIVMEVEKIVGDIEDPYYNRYAGFCTERLITLYFLYNKNHWKIAHAEKIFIN